MTELIHKILTEDQWSTFARAGHFDGSAHDRRDGFIHMCSGPQLQGTLDKHYADVQKVYLVSFMATGLGNDLKWEISRGGEKFPHLYIGLPFSALVKVHRLAQTQPCGFVLPRDL